MTVSTPLILVCVGIGHWIWGMPGQWALGIGGHLCIDDRVYAASTPPIWVCPCMGLGMRLLLPPGMNDNAQRPMPAYCFHMPNTRPTPNAQCPLACPMPNACPMPHCLPMPNAQHPVPNRQGGRHEP